MHCTTLRPRTSAYLWSTSEEESAGLFLETTGDENFLSCRTFSHNTRGPRSSPWASTSDIRCSMLGKFWIDRTAATAYTLHYAGARSTCEENLQSFGKRMNALKIDCPNSFWRKRPKGYIFIGLLFFSRGHRASGSSAAQQSRPNLMKSCGRRIAPHVHIRGQNLGPTPL